VAQQRILRPNNKRPFESVGEFVDTERIENRLNLPPDSRRWMGGDDEVVDPAADRVTIGRLEKDELLIDQMVMRRIDGEVKLNARAHRELLPYFVANRLGSGIMGLVVIGILAVSMASFDSGIHSLATVMLVDFHRRSEGLRAWWAGDADEPAARWTESDELRLVRPLTAAVGLLTIFLALMLNMIDGSVWFLGALTVVIAGPLLAVFALGFATRAATGVGVSCGLVVGLMVNTCLVFVPAVARHFSFASGLYSGEPLAWGWVMIWGVAVTWVMGLLLSLFLGRRRTKQEIRGLVIGVGELGERDVLTEVIPIPGEEDSAEEDPRWRQ